jgi:hypothetical protein
MAAAIMKNRFDPSIGPVRAISFNLIVRVPRTPGYDAHPTRAAAVITLCHGRPIAPTEEGGNRGAPGAPRARRDGL